jgi:transcriptional regulator with XRE-family HTH domain
MVVRFDSAHFRVWLANAMRRRRMSQRMLGERAGVDHSTISRLLRTGRTPSTETMVALATALGADLPGYLAPAPTQGPIDTRIRRALTDLGVEPAVTDEMLAVYRRSQMRRSESDLTG